MIRHFISTGIRLKLALLLLLGAFALGSAGIAGTARVAAQDATPETPSSDAESAIYVDEHGEEVARITVDEVIDPFEEYEEGYDPERGTRYVAIRVTVEATGEDSVQVNPYHFSLLDSQGFWLGESPVYRTSEEEDADPLLEDTEVAPDDSVSGLVFFVVFADNDIDQILWQPAGDRLITLANVS